MKKLARLIKKNEQREFSKCIRVLNGSAYYTDSFSLIEQLDVPSRYKDGMYDKKLNKIKPINYPDIEAAIPTAIAREICPDRVLEAIVHLKSRMTTKIGIDSIGSTGIINTDDPGLNSCENFTYFEFFRIARYMSIFTAKEKTTLKVFLYPVSERVRLCLTVDGFRVYFCEWKPPEIDSSFLGEHRALK